MTQDMIVDISPIMVDHCYVGAKKEKLTLNTGENLSTIEFELWITGKYEGKYKVQVPTPNNDLRLIHYLIVCKLEICTPISVGLRPWKEMDFSKDVYHANVIEEDELGDKE